MEMDFEFELENPENKEPQKGYYTIVAPGTIQPDLDYAVNVTLHKSTEPVTIQVGITGPSYKDNKTIELQEFSSEMIIFKIPPQLKEGDYELIGEGVKGLIFKDSYKLLYKKEEPKIYIQTDKATYKPGDSVLYRILALDRNLQPAHLHEPLNLLLSDGASNQIKQIKNLQFNKGVHRGQFQLSDQPVLGEWNFDITTEGEENQSKISKSFEVAKYVLPKFSVEIETEPEIGLLDKIMNIIVLSKYTYGQPVKGKLKILTKLMKYSLMLGSAEKTMDINGKVDVKFDIMEDLNMKEKSDNDYGDWQINIEAIMTEAFTDIQRNATMVVNLRRSRYTITPLYWSMEYELDKPFEMKALIKDLKDRPLTNAKAKAKLKISRDCDMDFTAKEDDILLESAVNADGIAVFPVNIIKNVVYKWMIFKYEEEITTHCGFSIKRTSDGTASPSSEESVGHLALSIETEGPKLGEEFIVNVKSDNPLSNFGYCIIARGKIVRHELVRLAEHTKCHSLKIMATFEMTQCANIFAYFIDETGEFRFANTDITFEKQFQNQLKITAPDETKPGTEVQLQIKTDPESLVGLLAVDESVLLLQTGNDFDSDHIFHDLNCYDSDLHVEDRWICLPGKYCGLVTLTNAALPKPKRKIFLRKCCKRKKEFITEEMFYDDEVGEWSVDCCAAGPINPPVRKNFVETWIFDDIESTNANGLTTFTKKIPDTITSWVITGFSLNPHSGFCMTEEPTKVRVFQPFFLSTNLPYSIKRGEVLAVPIIVSNYMDHELEAVVTMENPDDEYEFMEDTSDFLKVSKKMIVPSNGGETLTVTIKPKIVGEIMLKVKAITPVAGDAIHQKLKVEPEGVTQYESQAQFINIEANGQSLEHTLKANIPKDVVEDSEYLELTVVGDILGPTIKNIDQLVRMPYGCGEQNMINFVPNILVLEYLQAVGRDMPLVVEKAKQYMEKGYQRELTYKHPNGAFSTFGEGQSESNSWLTAYVVRSFIQARKYITIDETVIEEGLEYLLETQKENGQFPQTGELFHSSNQNELGVSAFILLAFLEDKVYATEYSKEIEKSLQYLADHVENEDNIYSLALILLVFQKSKHPLAEKVIDKLQQKSKFENSLKWWSNSTEFDNNDIEVTSYVLQALLETEEEPGKILPIIKWLIGQRNNLGGFDSTQDTVVGLQALVAFAEKYSPTRGGGKVKIHFKAMDEEGVETTSCYFEVDQENSFILQSHLLPKTTRQVCCTATATEGSGSFLIQLSYNYNLNVPENKPNFHIEYKSKVNPLSGQLALNVSAEYKPQPTVDRNESNMAVMEISLPSGYITHMDNLKALQSASRIQRVEMKNDDTIVVVYFERLVAGELSSFDIFANKSHAVDNLKPTPITIYDYYNTKQRATLLYQI
ncbi:CD109 antigen-like [Musca autumnalis]|uniref:CD109 antigen-like n=1 Tax=Musca autumnalis TaxID=221902 RepID=UPI003CF30A2C